MLTSEQDAKGRWCPFSRVVYQFRNGEVANAAGNRLKDDNGLVIPTSSFCIGSGCMAWRWDGWVNTTFDTIAPNPPPEDRKGPRLGHCGLSGQPSGRVQD